MPERKLKAEIAYVDDNHLNLECIKLFLQEDFEVQTFMEPEKFLSTMDKKSYSAMILDIHMPVIDGFKLHEQIISNPNYNGCPIFFFSSDNTELNRIKSYELGAIDFIGKEVSPDELVLRIKSGIEFYDKNKNVIECGSLLLNLTKLKSFLHGDELPLTFLEFKILFLILKSHPGFVSKDQLVEYVWRSDYVLDATIYTHISNLNRKLENWEYEINGLKLKGIQLLKKVC